MITLDNVTKKYGQKVAVKDLNLNIAAGECFVFLGPNGAGKTTTIKMITGLLRPTTGKVTVAGYDINNNPLEAKLQMSYIPDVPYLYDKLTGWEFLQFVGKLFKMSKETVDNQLQALLAMFKLEDHQYRLIEDYSHGIRQRFVICAALLHNPKIIVVDEPMVALDPAGIRLVKDIFKKKIREGVTIFMSTHTLSIAEEMAARIGIINNGRLIALGTKPELQKMIAGDKNVELEEVFLNLTK